MKIWFFVLYLFFCNNSFSKNLLEASPPEIRLTEKRIKDFYSWPIKPEAMDSQGIKTDPFSGASLLSHPELFTQVPNSEPRLIKEAGWKTKSKYRNWYCKKVLKKISPNFPCGKLRLHTMGDFLLEDKVSNLAQTWVEKVAYSPDEIPTEGESARPLWSDDYWAMVRGLTSYRYSYGGWFNDYREAIESYWQPQEWLSLVNFGSEKLNQNILMWSPAEKYDLSINDLNFTLTNQQKKEGKLYESDSGEVEPWMGLCHGWAPASIMVPRPMKALELPGPNGSSVIWYPNDIKAMVTLAWANGEWESNFVGRRCEQKKLKTFPNGRIHSQDCFDTNPATFHLALGNLIGKAKASFVMDKAYDYQVWNQPLVAYQFEYFNPLEPEVKSKNWEDVAVKYDNEFKKRDRFQMPLTRGKFMEGFDERNRHRTGAQDAHIEKMVGVIATVVYLVETTPPDFGPSPGADRYGRDIYLYDLEVAKREGQWAITGGEWHQNNHPDFLFVPRKNAAARAYWDFLGAEPNFIGPRASETNGYPLCEVVKRLVEGAAEETVQYNCQSP